MQLSAITVTLKLFATFRRYLPPESQGGAHDLSVPAGTRASEVLEGLGVPVDGGVVILINGRTGAPQQVLEEGDVVAAFPAMAGG
jgi:molybdopterin converting factor small subunit